VRFAHTTSGGPVLRATEQRRLSTLVASLFLTQLGAAMTAVAAVLLLVDRFGIGVESGVALALQVAPNVLLGPVVGDLVSKRDPRKVAVASSLASALVVMLYPLATTPAFASVVAVLIGVAGLPAISSRMALRASVIPEALQQQASGYIVAAERLGLVLGPLVATLIATAGNYTYIFYFEAVLASISGALILTLPRPAMSTPTQQARTAGWAGRLAGPYRRAWALVRSDRLILEYTISGVLYSVGIGAQRLLLPAMLVVTLRTSQDQLGLLIAALAAGGIVGGLAVGRFRISSPARWYVAITLAEVPLWLATFVSPNVGVLVLLLALLGVLEGSGIAIYFTEIQRRIPGDQIGRYFSLMSPSVDVAIVAGVLAISIVPEASVPVVGTLLVAGAAGLPFLLLWRLVAEAVTRGDGRQASTAHAGDALRP